MINFDTIYKRLKLKGDQHQQQYFDKHYQTVYSSNVKQMSQKERKKTVGVCLRSEKKNYLLKNN